MTKISRDMTVGGETEARAMAVLLICFENFQCLQGVRVTTALIGLQIFAGLGQKLDTAGCCDIHGSWSNDSQSKLAVADDSQLRPWRE
jgi:hypothetical protein